LTPGEKGVSNAKTDWLASLPSSTKSRQFEMIAFTLIEQAAPLPSKEAKATIEALLRQISDALVRDPFLQSSFLPVYLGDATPRPLTEDDTKEFLASFSEFIANLTLPVHLRTFGSTRRPKPGEDGVIRLNNTLAHACVRIHPDPTFSQFVTVASICHELAHLYETSLRPTTGSYSPLLLSLPGYEDKLEVNGSMNEVGEAGFVQEKRLLGGPFYVLVAATTSEGDFSEIKGVHLDVDGVFYNIREYLLISALRANLTSPT
jgi:hypothetical protein